MANLELAKTFTLITDTLQTNAILQEGGPENICEKFEQRYSQESGNK